MQEYCNVFEPDYFVADIDGMFTSNVNKALNVNTAMLAM